MAVGSEGGRDTGAFSGGCDDGSGCIIIVGLSLHVCIDVCVFVKNMGVCEYVHVMRWLNDGG